MTNCMLCGHSTAPLFSARDYRRPNAREDWLLNWCSTCGFGRLQGQFTPAQVAAFYPTVYYTHGTEPSDADNPHFLDRLRTHLAWRLDSGQHLMPAELQATEDRPSRLCDLGCGSGDQLRLFKEAGYEVIGVEPDRKARTLAQDVAEVLDGTAEEIPPSIASMQFGVVLLSHVLEHCINPIAALSNARKILSPSGTLVIEVPNCASARFSTFREAWPWTDIPRHINFFTERSLRIALKKERFMVTKVTYVGYTRQFQRRWIETQADIWARLGNRSKRNFGRAAWQLLLRTACASAKGKYDSVRIHASHF